MFVQVFCLFLEVLYIDGRSSPSSSGTRNQTKKSYEQMGLALTADQMRSVKRTP